MAEDRYQKLPGSKRDFFGSQRLWMGRDHLLWVTTVMFTENYRRFYYSDIQSITLLKTRTWAVENVILGLIVVGWAVFAYFLRTYGNEFVWIVLGGFGGVFVLILGVNLALGPTCKCYLQTAVGTYKLPPLHRIRTARKTIRMIRQQIEHHQSHGRVTSH